MNARSVLLATVAWLGAAGAASAQGTRLLRHPTVSRELVAFEYAGDLWAVNARFDVQNPPPDLPYWITRVPGL